MTDQQPTALRLADELIEYIDGPAFHVPHHRVRDAAAELRRLHEEVHAIFDIGYNIQTELFAAKARIAALEKALTQAVEALTADESKLWPSDKRTEALATARQTLGGAA